MQTQCPTCHRVYTDTWDTFCADCGTRLPASPSLPPPSGAGPILQGAPAAHAQTPASKGSRIGGYLIDILILVLLYALNILPILGQYLSLLLSVAYILFRDVNGASFGKTLLGNVVVSKSGAPASTGQRILRNVILVVPYLPDLIPVVGVAAVPFFELGIALLELFCLLFTGERIGDKIAKTAVIKRR